MKDQVAKHTGTLRRRLEFLQSREHKNSWDLAEIAAIEWALLNLPSQPRPWVGLTQQDIDIAFDDTQEGGGFDEFAHAIEAKLKEKNHG